MDQRITDKDIEREMLEEDLFITQMHKKFLHMRVGTLLKLKDAIDETLVIKAY